MAWHSNYYANYYNPYAQWSSASPVPALVGEPQSPRFHTTPSRTAPAETGCSEDETYFFARGRGYTSASPARTGESVPKDNLISFLATAQTREVDFLPMTWESGRERVGIGGTADIRQSFQNLKLSYVFKRIRRERVNEGYAFQAFSSEVFILGNPEIRGHNRIVRLAGISWDVGATNEPILPVLVFEKSQHGDLGQFIESPAGMGLGFDERLKLCADVAAAIVVMHSHGIIHGDIKPGNVLIFDDENLNDYTAKVTDFGYSVYSEGKYPEERRIHLPISDSWNAPEVTCWDALFSFNEAKLADIYSFGLLCLWILFPKIHRSIFKGLEDGDLYSKQDGNLQQTVTDLIDRNTELDRRTKTCLQAFFASTLASDPDDRNLDLNTIMRPFVDFEITGVPSHSHYETWIPYMKWTPHHKDFDLTALQEKYYEKWEKGALGQDTSQLGAVEPFQLSKSFRLFMGGDYRLWEHIFQALKSQTSDSPASQEEKSAAFELAVCCQLGFGTERNASEAALWLERSERSDEELMREIEIIKADKGPLLYKNFEPPVDMKLATTDFWLEVWQTATLADAENTYSIAAKNSDFTLGEDHPVSVYLNTMVAKMCLRAVKEDKAQEILEKLVDVSEEFLGPGHPLTLEIIALLASCYMIQGKLELARMLEEGVLERKSRRFGEKNGPGELGSMQRLASIYKQAGQWDAAESWEIKIYQGYEITMGADHPRTLCALADLVRTYKSQGQLDKAEELGRRLLDKTPTVAGLAADYVADIMDTLGAIFESQKRWQDMVDVVKRAIDIRKKEKGPEHPLTMISMQMLACAYSKELRFDEALEIQTDIMDTSTRVYGLYDPDTLDSMENLATTLKRSKKYQESISLMEKVVSLREQLQGKSDVHTLSSRVALMLLRNQARQSADRQG